MQKCLLQKIELAESDMTVGELRLQCESDHDKASLSATANSERDVQHDVAITPVQMRLADEQTNYDRAIAISAFKPNYLMATYMADPNEAPFAAAGQGDILLNEELKFQISIKAPL